VRKTKLGTCVRITYEGCAAGLLDDIPRLTRHLKDVARLTRLRIVKSVAHRYRPQGATIVFILKESHLVLHTWPEFRAAVLELFSCAPRTPGRKIEKALRSRLKASASRFSSSDIGAVPFR